MVWSCGACTFENGLDKAVLCSICGTQRIAPSSATALLDLTRTTTTATTTTTTDKLEKSAIAVADKDKRKDPAPSTKKQRQGTLFGGIASLPEDEPFSKKRKKRVVETKREDMNRDTSLVASKQNFPYNSNASSSSTTTTTKTTTTLDKTLRHEQKSQQQRISSAPYYVLRSQAEEQMKSVFGISSLRALQPKAIELALKRKSQIIVMATGGGKSLCFQLPAIVLGGVTLVISPLIALMVDQVQSLKEKGIEAALVSSASGARNNARVMEQLLGRRNDNKNTTTTTKNKKSKSADNDNDGLLKPITLLYGTPELLQTDKFRNVLQELHTRQSLTMFAIDEAHCVSTWGHDFRHAYRQLGWLRTTFPTIPVMACTATATAKVIMDIRETLQLTNTDSVPCLLSSFNRPNISYQVRFKDSLDAMRPGGALGDLIQFIRQEHDTKTITKATPKTMESSKDDDNNNSSCISGIIYVHKREDTAFLAQQISSATRIPAASYHGGLSDAERSLVQQDWTSGKLKIAVATVAFGMGIDLAHVRYVIHWSMPKTIEGFYQESGRAGRDGLHATSILYYSKDDASKFAFIIRKTAAATAAAKKKRGGGGGGGDLSTTVNASAEPKLEALQQMMNYCMVPACRRQYLLSHFGEKVNPKEVCNKTCDYCQNPDKIRKETTASDVVKDVMKSAAHFSRGMKHSKEWDGQWNKPHGDNDSDADDDNYFGNDWTAGDLRITSSSRGHEDDNNGWEERKPSFGIQNKKKGFQKASAVLSKYEKMECQQNQPDGFVNFRSNNDDQKSSASFSIPHRPVVIPEHLRHGLPDPLQHMTKTINNNSNNHGNKSQSTSSELADRAKEMKANLEKLKLEREAKMKALLAKTKLTSTSTTAAASLPPPPPPMLTFKKTRR